MVEPAAEAGSHPLAADVDMSTHAPATPRQAGGLFAGDGARETFSEDVGAHALNSADVELRAFAAPGTDRERFRGFARR